MSSRFLGGVKRNARFSDELIRLLPKTDIHLHLDGSMRLQTLIDLAKEQNLQLPAYTVEGLRNTVFKDSYVSLEEYLQPFQYLTAVLRTKEALERVSFEVAEDCYKEGVRYFETRLAPHLHAVPGVLSVEEVLLAINRGLSRAAQLYNKQDSGVGAGIAPEYRYGIIVVGLRYFNDQTSPVYKNFLELFQHESPKKVFGLATLQIAKAAVYVRDTHDLPIVALDIAGCEAHFPAADHAEAFLYAHEHHMNKTIHAGEAFGPESIFQAITACFAERIGHGTRLYDTTCFHPDTPVKDKEGYTAGIIKFIANRRICIEVCLTSNFQTDPSLRGNVRSHPLGRFLKDKLSVCLNTDNRTVSNTTISDEVRLAVDLFDLTREELWEVIYNGFNQSFIPGSYPSKLAYMEKVKTFYNRIFDAHLQ